MILLSVEVGSYAIPHFKAAVNGKVEPWCLECASTFSIQISLLNISHLLHKSGLVEIQPFTTVSHFSKPKCRWSSLE